MLSWSWKRLQKPPEIRSIARSKESLGKCEKRVSTISRRCRLASCLCKTRCHRTSHPTANRKRNQSRGFPASWGLVSKKTASMAAQLPDAADFTRPRLELGPDCNTSWQGTKPACYHPSLTVAAKWNQVKISELFAGKQQQCKLHLQARGLLWLWWQLHAPCFWNVSSAVQIPNATQRCRWISQSAGSAIPKLQAAFW